MKFELTSTAFTHQGDIPVRFTCDGDNALPQLSWSGVPQIAKSLALIVDNPDAPNPAAPKRTWVHWVLYNISAACLELHEHMNTRSLPTPAQQGVNAWGNAAYGGPCPPIGRHRCFHKLYPLDTYFPDLQRPTKAQLLVAMKGLPKSYWSVLIKGGRLIASIRDETQTRDKLVVFINSNPER